MSHPATMRALHKPQTLPPNTFTSTKVARVFDDKVYCCIIHEMFLVMPYVTFRTHWVAFYRPQ